MVYQKGSCTFHVLSYAMCCWICFTYLYPYTLFFNPPSATSSCLFHIFCFFFNLLSSTLPCTCHLLFLSFFNTFPSYQPTTLSSLHHHSTFTTAYLQGPQTPMIARVSTAIMRLTTQRRTQTLTCPTWRKLAWVSGRRVPDCKSELLDVHTQLHSKVGIVVLVGSMCMWRW